MSQHDRDERPDPDPERTSEAESGGEIPPNETPRPSSSVDEGLAHAQYSKARPGKWAWMVVVAIVILLAMLFFGVWATGMLS